MEKRIILLFIVFVCGIAHAQKLRPSFQEDFLQEMYENSDESIREELKKMETPRSEYFFLAKDMTKLHESLVEVSEQNQKGKKQLMSYESQDFLAFLFFDDEKEDVQFECFYVTPDNRICCLKLLDNTGKFYKPIVTKSKAKYIISHEWGFLKISKNYLDFLNCYYDYSKKAGQNYGRFFIIPFEGTSISAWKLCSEQENIFRF